MIGHLRLNIQLFSILFIWVVSAAIFVESIFITIPMSIFLLLRRDNWLSVFLGFWFILILSDSTIQLFHFAHLFKPLFIVILGAVIWLRRREFDFSKNVVFRSFSLFILWAFILIYRSPEPIVSFQKTLSYGLLLLVVPTLVNRFLNEDKKHFLRSMVFFGISILVAAQLYSIFNFETTYLDGRFHSIFRNPNGLGMFCMMLYFLNAIAQKYVPGLFSKKERWIVLSLIIVSLLMTKTRSAILSILIFEVLRTAKYFAVFIGPVLSFSLIYFNQEFAGFLQGLLKSVGLASFFRLETITAGSGRLVAWQFALEKIQDNFFVGNGFNFTDYVFKQNYAILSRLGHSGNAHQSLLTIWLDTGLIGLILFCAAFLILVYRASKNNYLAWPFFYAIVFSISFESWLTASLNPFTIILILLLSVLLYKEPEKNISSET